MPSNAQSQPANGSKGKRRKKSKLFSMPEYAKSFRKRGEMDIGFLIIVMLLLVIGIIMMYSASYAWAINAGLESDYYFNRQLRMAIIGLVVLFITANVDYHLYRVPFVAIGAYIGSMALMLMCFIPAFSSDNEDANRWISIGSLSFQPSELMKLAMIFLLALVLSNNYNTISSKNTLLPSVLPSGIIMAVAAGLMIIQRHISGAIIIAIIGLMMAAVSGMRKRYILFILLVGTVVGLLAIELYTKIKNYDYLAVRIDVWQHPFDDERYSNGENWQIKNSLIAIGSGGLFGLGFGNSRQKFLYLPESKNDFIFAIVCEELGLVGALVVILLFLLLVIRGFKIATNAPDKFGMLTAAGIVFQIGLQALLNIAVVTNAMPNTGISLPFFSYGGTALIMQLAEMGIVLNVSRQSVPDKETEDSDIQPQPQPPAPKPTPKTVKPRRR